MVSDSFIAYELQNPIVDRALSVAIKAHDGQLRKWTKEPEAYITHPIRVAEKVWNYITSSVSNVDDNLKYIVSAALLHDVVEDTHVSLKTLQITFPNEITDLVAELTDPVFEEGLSRDCKFGVTVKKWYGLSSFASLIKLADRLDNLSDCQYAPRRWLDKYLVESGILACVLGDRHPGLGDELKKRIRSLAG